MNTRETSQLLALVAARKPHPPTDLGPAATWQGPLLEIRLTEAKQALTTLASRGTEISPDTIRDLALLARSRRRTERSCPWWANCYCTHTGCFKSWLEPEPSTGPGRCNTCLEARP